MVRALLPLALLAATALTAGLILGRQQRCYRGAVHEVEAGSLTIDVLDGPDDLVMGMSLGLLPSTLRGRLSAIKSLEWIGLTLPAPASMIAVARKGQKAELRHAFLRLPWMGDVLGATTLRVGDVEWREPRSGVYALTLLLGTFPLLLWLLAAAFSPRKGNGAEA